MPTRDERTRATTRAGKNQTAGRQNVSYRDVNGKSQDASVLGPGTGSGLKLRLASRNGNGTAEIVDNVAAATSAKQTNVYFSRDRIS